MTQKLIIFDWNGTILADTIPALKASNICLNFFDRPSISMATFRQTFDFPVIKFYEAHGVSLNQMLAKKEESNVLFQSSYERLAKHCRTRRGVRDVLSEFKSRGHHMIILSNYVTDKILPQLERLDIAHYFDHVCAHNCDGTTILQSTSKLERVHAYMQANKFQADQTTIIGDSLEEPELANHLGLTGISITGGVVSEARLKAQNPTHLIRSMKKCVEIV